MVPADRKFNMVRVDTDAIRRAMERLGFDNSSLGEKSNVERRTVAKLLRTGEVRNDCFEAIVKAIGGLRDDYLADPLRVVEHRRSPYGLPPTEEWAVDDSIPCSEWMKAANGLQYRICRMRHLTIADHFGRGKFYDLLGVRKEVRDKLQHQLERHAIVGMTVEPSPHLPQLYSCVRAGQGEGWWVIDRWIDGISLRERLTRERWPRKDLPRLMKDVLCGLAQLHSHNIVLRELHPGCILIPTEKRQPVITDLEMAKLSNGAPTVRTGTWPTSPFLAPEVDSDEVTPSADIFSWAVILLNAATGREPDATKLKVSLTEAALPESVTEVVKACLSSAPSKRPQNCETLRKAISKWV